MQKNDYSFNCYLWVNVKVFCCHVRGFAVVSLETWWAYMYGEVEIKQPPLKRTPCSEKKRKENFEHSGMKRFTFSSRPFLWFFFFFMVDGFVIFLLNKITPEWVKMSYDCDTELCSILGLILQANDGVPNTSWHLLDTQVSSASINHELRLLSSRISGLMPGHKNMSVGELAMLGVNECMDSFVGYLWDQLMSSPGCIPTTSTLSRIK